MWCPECKMEYIDGIKECKDCGGNLVEKTQIPEEPEINEAFLITVPDEMGATVLESLLKSYNIPVLRKYRESSSYLNIYMGETILGIDLFVPEDRLEEAMELVNAKNNEISEEEFNSASDKVVEDDDYNEGDL